MYMCVCVYICMHTYIYLYVLLIYPWNVSSEQGKEIHPKSHHPRASELWLRHRTRACKAQGTVRSGPRSPSKLKNVALWTFSKYPTGSWEEWNSLVLVAQHYRNNVLSQHVYKSRCQKLGGTMIPTCPVNLVTIFTEEYKFLHYF